jgi:23S rRNA pseudouridine2604 synthase
MTPPKKEAFPMRINQYLAHQGLSTRRGGDDLIVRKKVFINGRLAVLGDKVNEGDVVEVRGATPKSYVYFTYNKPKGVVTHSSLEGQEDIADQVGHELGKDVFPVGRLDRDSYGLIILTNDGRITDRLLNPDRTHDKEYAVKTREKLRDSFKKHMEAGVDIDGYITKSAKVVITGDYAFTITLTEGKKHQIRRMVVALHNETVDLKRVRVMNIVLGNLKSGQHRQIDGEELQTFLKNLGL